MERAISALGGCPFFLIFPFFLLIFIFKLQKYVLGKISNDSVGFVGFSQSYPSEKGKNPNLVLNYCDSCITLEINL